MSDMTLLRIGIAVAMTLLLDGFSDALIQRARLDAEQGKEEARR